MAAIDNLYGAVTLGTAPISSLYGASAPVTASPSWTSIAAPAPKPAAPTVPSFTSIAPPTANPFSAYPDAAAAYTAAKKKQAASGVSSYADPYAAEHAAVGAMTPTELAKFQATYAKNNTGGWFDAMMKYAPVVLAGVASGGVGAGVGAAAGGGLAGGVAGGAAAGVTSAEASSLANNASLAKPGTVAKGAVIGGIGGGIASQLGGATKALTNSGLPAPVASGLVKGAAGAATGAVGGAITGQGASKGAIGGAIAGGTSAVAGSIFNSGNTVNTSNSTVIPPPQTTNMADDSLDYITPTGQYAGQNMDGSTYGGGSGSGGYYDPNDPVVQANTQAGQQYYSSGNPGGTVGNGSSGGAGSLLATLASKLFGSNVSPQNMSMLSSLLGFGANAGAGVLNSNAAKGAANTFGQQTKFNPYAVQTSGGNTSYSNGNATSTLSAGNQANLNGLNNLSQQSLAGLQAGPQGAANQYYQQLQAQQKQGNDRLIANTTDNEFGKGILASTAGQYQTQGAVDSIHNQNLQDSVLANNFGQGQQQQQLNQLTAGLNGAGNINSQQLQQLMYGGNLGSEASNANQGAYKPSLVANSNSTFGGILSALGNQTNNNVGGP